MAPRWVARTALTGLSAGGVQIWDLPGSQDNCVLWGTGRGHPLRWGYVAPG